MQSKMHQSSIFETLLGMSNFTLRDELGFFKSPLNSQVPSLSHMLRVLSTSSCNKAPFSSLVTPLTGLSETSSKFFFQVRIQSIEISSTKKHASPK